jgi:hypothetical protein
MAVVKITGNLVPLQGTAAELGALTGQRPGTIGWAEDTNVLYRAKKDGTMVLWVTLG